MVSKRDRLDDLKWEYENIKDKRYKYPRYLKFLIKTLEQDETYELNSGECVDYPFNGVFISPDFQGYYFMKLEILRERLVDVKNEGGEIIGQEYQIVASEDFINIGSTHDKFSSDGFENWMNFEIIQLLEKNKNKASIISDVKFIEGSFCNAGENYGSVSFV